MMKTVHVLKNIVRPMACAMLSVYLFLNSSQYDMSGIWALVFLNSVLRVEA